MSGQKSLSRPAVGAREGPEEENGSKITMSITTPIAITHASLLFASPVLTSLAVSCH